MLEDTENSREENLEKGTQVVEVASCQGSRETNYQLLTRLVTEALQNAPEDGEPVQNSKIKKWIETNYPEEWLTLLPSYTTYLTRAVQDETTRIARTPGKYSYLLRTPVESIAPEDEIADEPPEAEESRKQAREECLYPPLVGWLQSAKWRARITANAKKGGVWGNPDVTGLRIVDGFAGQKDVEITTIEAKVSRKQWKKEFFEAVSHRRFAHRAYFAFAEGNDDPSLEKLQHKEELRSYGERFSVGILVIFMPVALYEELRTGDTTSLKLGLDDIRVEELWPAVYENVTPKAVRDFLTDVCEIKDDSGLYSFGFDPNDG